MIERQSSYFKVDISINNSTVVAMMILDKKNKSIHIHLYGDMFDQKKSAIDTRIINAPFPDCEDKILIEKIIMDEIKSDKLQIDAITSSSIEELKDFDKKYSVRKIIRYKK